jgi:prepilin-type N-terminal cleavage/methylation domain-containing protein
MRKKKVLRNEKGFTLVEIIAVLVILGILAAVAIPKYFDLQADAKKKAAEGAMAEVVARVNQHFAKSLLGGATPGGISYTTGTLGPVNMGDFTIDSVSDDGTSITLNISGSAPPVAGVTASKTIPRPSGG